MKKTLALFPVLLILIGFSSCYVYDGPIQKSNPKRNILPPPPIKIIGKADTKAEYLQKTFNEIKNTLPEAEVVMIEDSIKVLFPNNITYVSKDILPSSDYQPPLNQFCELLKKYKKTNILISGHSDNRGNEIKNKNLSKLRADNIKDFMINHGVQTNRLESWGLGSISPIADNSTDEGRMKNRRVEFVVLYRD